MDPWLNPACQCLVAVRNTSIIHCCTDIPSTTVWSIFYDCSATSQLRTLFCLTMHTTHVAVGCVPCVRKRKHASDYILAGLVAKIHYWDYFYPPAHIAASLVAVVAPACYVDSWNVWTRRFSVISVRWCWMIRLHQAACTHAVSVKLTYLTYGRQTAIRPVRDFCSILALAIVYRAPSVN